MKQKATFLGAFFEFSTGESAVFKHKNKKENWNISRWRAEIFFVVNVAWGIRTKRHNSCSPFCFCSLKGFDIHMNLIWYSISLAAGKSNTQNEKNLTHVILWFCGQKRKKPHICLCERCSCLNTKRDAKIFPKRENVIFPSHDKKGMSEHSTQCSWFRSILEEKKMRILLLHLIHTKKCFAPGKDIEKSALISRYSDSLAIWIGLFQTLHNANKTRKTFVSFRPQLEKIHNLQESSLERTNLNLAVTTVDFPKTKRHARMSGVDAAVLSYLCRVCRWDSSIPRYLYVTMETDLAFSGKGKKKEDRLNWLSESFASLSVSLSLFQCRLCRRRVRVWYRSGESAGTHTARLLNDLDWEPKYITPSRLAECPICTVFL